MTKQKNIKYFLILLIISISFVFLSYYYKSSTASILKAFQNSLIYFKKENNVSNICNPIKHSVDQFKITLDGATYPQLKKLTRNKSINFKCLNQAKTKLILFWNPFFSSQDYYFGLGEKTPFIKNNCPVVNCETTADKSRLNESHVVITHMRNSIENLPKYRPVNQRWIFFLWESPIHANDFKTFNGFYNLTYTYKIDSDFSGVYESGSRMYWGLNETFNSEYDFSAEKTQFAAAVISNCGGNSRRIEYINRIKRHVTVDLFGKCGKPCPTNYRNSNIKAACKEIIAKEYKFYLAFENSVCTDYITEKFFYILQFNIIPVVLGGGKYDNYVSVNL